jgi:hypothetical protein
MIEAVDETGGYFALPYGPSSTAPEDNVREFEKYFEELEEAGLSDMKRPDLLLYRASDREEVEEAVNQIGGVPRLPFTPETHSAMRLLISRAILAVECENSLWRATKMPDYGAELKPMERLGGKPGLKKSAVLPTIIIKEEDRPRLWEWQRKNHLPIHIWHVFFDAAFGLALAEAQRLIDEKLILGTEQVFQAPSGATTKKIIYKIYHQYAYPLAMADDPPKLEAASIEDKNGHILPYVKFVGGSWSLTDKAVSTLSEAASAKNARK